MQMDLVIGLLGMIVLLLCTDFKERPRVVWYGVFVAVAIIVGKYALPVLLGLGAALFDTLGWKVTLCLAAVLVVASILYVAWRSDARDNAAIRAGSAEAFSRRVEAYKQDPYNYSQEKAVDAATRLREGN